MQQAQLCLWEQTYKQCDEAGQIVLFKYIDNIQRNCIYRVAFTDSNYYLYCYPPQNQIGPITKRQITKSKINDNIATLLKCYVEKQIINYVGNVMIIKSKLYQVDKSFEYTKKQIQLNNNYKSQKCYIYYISNDQQSLIDFIKQPKQDTFWLLQLMELLGINKQVQYLNKILSNVVGLDKATFINRIIPQSENYKWTVKTDGTRCLLLQTDKENIIITVEQHQQFTNNEIKYVWDGELVNNDIVYVFDCLIYNGINIMKKCYEDRYNYITKHQFKQQDNIQIHKKEFKQFNQIEELVEIFKSDEYQDQQIDGIVFNNMTKSYEHAENYKLKNTKYLTIDFLIKRVQQPPIQTSQNDIVFELYCGMNKKAFKFTNNEILPESNYQAMPFNIPIIKSIPSQYMILNKTIKQYVKQLYTENDYDQVIKSDDIIVECGYTDDMRPYPIRIRKDKTKIYKETKASFGNDFSVAVNTFLNRLDPITEEFLINPKKEQYFVIYKPSQEEAQKYKQFKLFGQFCREYAYNTIIEQVNNPICLLDIGSGRNSDYEIFLKNRFQRIICYEPDTQAVIRYYNKMMKQVIKYDKIPTYIVNDYISSSIKLTQYKCNVFSCNFAIHYLIDQLKELKQFILSYAKQDETYFQIIYYKAEDILKLTNNNIYNTNKYYIKILSKKQMQIKLPTINREIIDEKLVYIKDIQKALSPEFKLILDQQMINEYDGNMDQDDKLYNSLIYFALFKKVK